MQAVPRPADGDIHAACDWQGVNQPHAVFRIVSDGCVAGSRVGAAFIPLGETRQVAVGPGNSSVNGCSKANISAATAIDAAYLKRGHDRGAVSKSSRLDLRHVVTASVGKAVLTELAKNTLCTGRKGGEKAQAANKSENRRCTTEAAAVAGRNLRHRESTFFLFVIRQGGHLVLHKETRLRRTGAVVQTSVPAIQIFSFRVRACQ